VAAQLQRKLREVLGRPADELAAHRRRAGEGDLAADGILQEFGGDFLGPAHDHLEHARRQPGLVSRLGQGDRGQRRGAGGFEDHRAPGGQGGGHLADREHQGEIPGGSRPHHPDRRSDHQVPPGGGLRRHDPAVGPRGFAGKPPQVIDAHGHLGPALRQRLAVLHGDDAGDLIGTALEAVGDPRQQRAAVAPRERAPGGPGPLGVLEGLPDRVPADRADAGEHPARGRIDHVQPMVRLDPLAVEVQSPRLDHCVGHPTWGPSPSP